MLSLKEINARVHLFGTSKGFKNKRSTTFIQEKIMKESKVSELIRLDDKSRRVIQKRLGHGGRITTCLHCACSPLPSGI